LALDEHGGRTNGGCLTREGMITATRCKVVYPDDYGSPFLLSRNSHPLLHMATKQSRRPRTISPFLCRPSGGQMGSNA
jgi:hypothetical protein